MAIRTTVSSTLNVGNGLGLGSLNVNQHSNTGATAESAPVLMTVQADNIVTADQFAVMVANESTDMSSAFVARILNALNEVVQDIVGTATAAPNIDFGWGKFLFEIAGSLDTATGTPGIGNYCYFTGSVASKYQKQFALMDAYVDVSDNPCDFKRTRDAATSGLNVINGTAKFYAEGRGMTWGTSNDKQELYTLAGVKVCDLALTANDSYPTSLTLAIPSTATVPADDYVLRLDCAILGKVWRMERKVKVIVGVTPPAAPTFTKVKQDGRPDDTLKFDATTAFVANGTNLAFESGDTLQIKLYDAQGNVKDYGDITNNVTSSSSTAINVEGLYWNCGQEDEHFWYDGTCQAKLELTHGSTVTKRNITFVSV